MVENTNNPEQTVIPAADAVPSAASQPIAPAPNPLLARLTLPGQTFRLPSGGLFYNNGELSSDVESGEVHVHPMTAIDEIMIKTPDLLFSGKSIQEVFSRCIPQILKPTELLAKDVDFLLVCLRQITYGDTMELEATHTCEDAKTHGYHISTGEFIKKTKEIDPSKMATYTITFDNGQEVKLRPVKFTDYVQVMQTTAQLKRERTEDDSEYIVQQAKSIMFKSLLGVIISVEGVTNREHILGWLETISAGWIKQLSSKIEEMADWGPQFVSDVQCKDCGETFTLAAPLNPIAFFT